MNCKSIVAATSAVLVSAFFAPGQAAAQSASASAMLEEVVVTARRREETLADLPISVAAITAEAMQAQGVYAIEDITDVIPNLTLTSTDRRGIQALFIRGIGNDSTNNLTPVGAALYIDGHYMPNTLGQMMSLLDVERIEVLRGPQGTLFGMNTTGGAVNIITRKPQPEFESSVLLRAAEHGQQDFRGMLNIPISDTVLTRFSASSEQMDGYYFNRTLNRDVGAIDVSAFAGAVRFLPNDNWTVDLHYRQNKQRDDNAPGQCGARPTQDQINNLADLTSGTVDNNVLGSSFYDRSNLPTYNGPVYADEGIGPNDGVGQWGGGFDIGGVRTNVGGHVERLYPGATIDYWNDCITDAALGDYVTSYEKDTFVNLDNITYGASLNWSSDGAVGAFDSLNVLVNLSQHEVDYDYLQDRDFSSVKVDAIGTPPRGGDGQQQDNTQLEVLFNGDLNDRLELTAGFILFEDEWRVGRGECLGLAQANIGQLSIPPEIDDPNNPGTLIPNPAFTGFNIDCNADGGTQFDRLADRQVGGGPGVAGMSGLVTRDSQAIYGHLTYEISDAWSMDVGARWTEDERGFFQAEVDVPGALCTHSLPGDPAEDQQCVPTYNLSFDSLFAEGFYNDTTETWDKVTPMISFTRNLESGNLVYFRLAQGFLSGSFNDELNVNRVPELTPLLAYDPETVTNYEVGFKGSFRDGMVNLAGAVFFMDYEDKQENIGIDNTDGRFGGDPNIGIVTNAATVDIYGVELELRMIPWDNGFFSLDLGYLNNEYGQFSSFDPDAPGGTIDQSGLRIADYSPEWTINATLEHQFELANGATLRPQIGMYYQSEYDWIGGTDAGIGAGDSFCLQDSYAKFRARLTYEPAEGNWQASLYGQNIGDERYLERCNDGRRSGAFDFRYGRPAWYGAEFVYRWGNN